MCRSQSASPHTFLCPPQTLPDAAFDPLARFEGQLRLLPLAAGVAGIAGTLLNRVLSGVRTPEPYIVLPIMHM